MPLQPASLLVLCDHNGKELAEIESEHTVRFERSRAFTAKFKLDYGQNAAIDLINLLSAGVLPQVRAYRNTQLFFSGYWWPQQETAQGESDDGITCEFRSAFARLESRYLQALTTYSGVDAGQIVNQLVSATNGDSPTGIRIGTIEATVNRDRTYEIGQQIASAVVDLTNVQNGFQFTETMLDSSATDLLSELNIWSGLGHDFSDTIHFEYGEGTISNVTSVERTIAQPVNQVILVGDTISSVANDSTSQARVGLFSTSETFSDISDQTTLDQRAAGMLQPDFVQQVSFQPELDSDLRPIDDYWLGDIVTFYANQEALQIDSEVQITAIEFQRDGDGTELGHTLEFGSQLVQPLQAVRKGRRLVFRDASRT